MIFYEITLKTVPRFAFAYSVDVEKYENSFIERKRFLEITMQEKGSICYHHSDGTRRMVEPKTLSCIVSDMNCRSYAANGETQSHTTIGIFSEYGFRRRDSKTEEIDLADIEKRINDSGMILVPFQEALDAEYKVILPQFKKVVSYVNSLHPIDKINALSKWYELCYAITKLVYEKLQAEQFDISPTTLQYVSRVKEYIFKHYQEKISVKDIAGELKLSTGYIHEIFKKVTGMGVIEFLNDYRIKMAQVLIESENILLRDVAKQVGISDPSYLSRMFKKTLGVSYKEFCQHKTKRVEIYRNLT